MTDDDALRDAVRAGYDDIAATYDGQRTAGGRGRELVADLAADLDSGSRVLDAGCGAGRPVAETLADRHRVVGLDLSRGMLDRARSNVPVVRSVQGDLAALPFPDGAFDALVSYYAVIHVPREHHAEVFAEFARVLRPGGEALVVVGTEPWEGRNPDWLDAGVEMRWSFWGADRNRELLRAAGLPPVEAEVVDDELGGAFLHVRARRE
jgi:ubiquinone/menaquinone biosynthesis C-methylase UbiE